MYSHKRIGGLSIHLTIFYGNIITFVGMHWSVDAQNNTVTFRRQGSTLMTF